MGLCPFEDTSDGRKEGCRETDGERTLPSSVHPKLYLVGMHALMVFGDPFQDFTKTGHVNTHAGLNFPMRRWWGESGSCASQATTAPGTFSSELVSWAIIPGKRSGVGSSPFHPNLCFVLCIW